MSDEAPAKKVDEGLPAWMGTFADLMSLLMCFFVLLLSFSEMDVAKYKQLAGSMKMAFGVQRTIKSKEPPKGINVIAKEFSPGRPEPTPLNVVRQMTTSENNVNLDLGKERRRPVPTSKVDSNRGVNSGDRKEDVAGGQSKQIEGLTKQQQKALVMAKAAAKERLKDQLEKAAQQPDAKGGQPDHQVKIIKVPGKVAAQRQKKLEESARLISNALGKEIKAGQVEVELEDKKIIIRIKEKASFGSGTGVLKSSFKPLLGKVAGILKETEGMIRVAGHTDNLPIYNEVFRSNWALSSARAVSVVHAMMKAAKLPAKRFLVEGYAETQPIVSNKSSANRAINRRVEIILEQGSDSESENTSISAETGLNTRVPESRQQQNTSASAVEVNERVVQPEKQKRASKNSQDTVKKSTAIKSKGIRATGGR